MCSVIVGHCPSSVTVPRIDCVYKGSRPRPSGEVSFQYCRLSHDIPPPAPPLTRRILCLVTLGDSRSSVESECVKLLISINVHFLLSTLLVRSPPSYIMMRCLNIVVQMYSFFVVDIQWMSGMMLKLVEDAPFCPHATQFDHR